MNLRRILFLNSGPYFFDKTGKIKTKYAYISNFACGLIISPITELKYLCVKRINNFFFYPFRYYQGNSFLRIIFFGYEVLKRAKSYTKNVSSIDVVVSPDPLMSGLIGLLLKIKFNAKFIVEINGDFGESFKYDNLGSSKTGFVMSVKAIIAKTIMKFVLPRADGVRLLYREQLNFLDKSIVHHSKIFNFADYVPVENFLGDEERDEKYILLVGYPWYLKGVDILIEAFLQISDDFPEYKLKIVGWCPEGRFHYEKLTKGSKKILLCDPVEYKDIIPIFKKCSLYVLASRTEAMGRVLIEAMASRKPIVASNVGGVPSVIKDGFNGLLFESGNINDLSSKIRMLLGNSEKRRAIANNGYMYVKEKYSEANYRDNFNKMLLSVISKK